MLNHSLIIRGDSDRPSLSIIKIIVYFGILNLVLGLASPAACLGYQSRSCPRGLEGTGIMLATAAYVFAINLGNVFGSWVYSQGGFSTAMFITAVSTALILPVIRIVPPAIPASREGEGVEFAPSAAPG
jgi:hypothetical protein